FDALKELATGITKLKLFQEPLSNCEIKQAVQSIGASIEQGIDFEAFLWIYVELSKGGKAKVQSKLPSNFLKDSTTTLLHTISDSEKKAYIDHINTYLDGDSLLKKYLPIDSSTNDLFEFVKDGIILWYVFNSIFLDFDSHMSSECSLMFEPSKLINVAVPGTIDDRAINVKENLNPWERVENQRLCLNSAKAIGCPVVNIGTEDLIEGRDGCYLVVLSIVTQLGFGGTGIKEQLNLLSTQAYDEEYGIVAELEDAIMEHGKFLIAKGFILHRNRVPLKLGLGVKHKGFQE
ncbi:hypothetical protein KI387_011042, partial [Taxus chinensis]